MLGFLASFSKQLVTTLKNRSSAAFGEITALWVCLRKMLRSRPSLDKAASPSPSIVSIISVSTAPCTDVSKAVSKVVKSPTSLVIPYSVRYSTSRMAAAR